MKGGAPFSLMLVLLAAVSGAEAQLVRTVKQLHRTASGGEVHFDPPRAYSGHLRRAYAEVWYEARLDVLSQPWFFEPVTAQLFMGFGAHSDWPGVDGYWSRFNATLSVTGSGSENVSGWDVVDLPVGIVRRAGWNPDYFIENWPTVRWTGFVENDGPPGAPKMPAYLAQARGEAAVVMTYVYVIPEPAVCGVATVVALLGIALWRQRSG